MTTNKSAAVVDLVIRGGKVATSGLLMPAWIAVKGGRIVAIGSDGSPPEAKQTIDASGKYVLPGIVDCECHFIPPYEEALATETRAAIASGVTTWGLMGATTRLVYPPLPADSSGLIREEQVPLPSECFPRFTDLGDEYSMTDYFFTPYISMDRQAKDIPNVAEKYGVTSFKFYLHQMEAERYRYMWPRGQGQGWFHFDDGTIYIAMRNIAAIGPPGLLVIHPENWSIARVRREDLIAQGRADQAAWEEQSPDWCEAGHIRNYAYYAKITGCPLYIIHCTNAESIRAVLQGRAEGARLWAQTAAHYLTLDKTVASLNTPLRDRAARDACWEGLRTGAITNIGSDHVPEPAGRGTKESLVSGKEPIGDVWHNDYTFPSRVEGMLPIMLSEGVNKGRISLEKLVEVMCENPARAYGLYPKKGVITVGADADFVIVDLNKAKTYTNDMVYCRTGWTIWEGWEIKGWPIMTILRGKVMMEWLEGESRPKIVGKQMGRYLPRKLGHELYLLEPLD